MRFLLPRHMSTSLNATNYLIENTSRQRISKPALDSVVENAGALQIATGMSLSELVTKQQSRSEVERHITDRLRDLHNSLDGLGLTEADRDQVVANIAEIVGESGYGQRLAAGELYSCLANLQTPHLIQALGAREEIRVFLDTNVAIPALSAKLYEGTDKKYSQGSQHAYDQMQEHGVRALVLKDYVEEFATHMLDAYLHYGEVVGTDTDLRRSQNAFVAHYSVLADRGYSADFGEYLTGYGFKEKVARTADYYRARDTFTPRIERLLRRYGLEVETTGNISDESWQKANETIGLALEELGEENRASVLVKHDTRTLAYLWELARDPTHALVLSTWDQLHFHIASSEDAYWHALDPAVLGDLLSMATPSDDRRIASPSQIAFRLSEDEAELGARIWDKIAQLEEENLRDAEVLEQARKFKRDYIERQEQGEEVMDIATEWLRWKTERE